MDWRLTKKSNPMEIIPCRNNDGNPVSMDANNCVVFQLVILEK
jgi:hypothetical protein